MPEQKKTVTIEDLIRLKRAERPPVEFWEQFDRELRAKQLAALVEKRPWWQTMPRVSVGWRRLHLPLGATAVLAITFFSLREQPTLTPSSSELPPASAPVAAVRDDFVEPAKVAVAISTPAPEMSAEPVKSSEAPVLSQSSPDVAASGEGISPGELSRMVALVGEPANTTPTSNDVAPSARHIAANLAAAPVEPSLTRGLLVVPAKDTRPARGAVVEPLAQIPAPGDARRARFISAVAFAAMVDMTGQTAEREARKLSDERLNDHVRRFKFQANSLSMKL